MKDNKAAFTLVELLVTMVIMVILATIAYIYVENNISDGRDAKRKTDL
jgi:prepilin-type N-terminal cleavage/methylation domain-containing protein